MAMLTGLSDSWAYTIFSSPKLLYGIPVQIFWAIAFVTMLSAMLYNRHRFGAQVKVVGDNPDSARQMGIDVKRVRVKVFVFVGIGAAIAGTFSVMINFTWWPTAGDGYLLPVLASVFVGGTPTWGGIGTVCWRRDRRGRPSRSSRPALSAAGSERLLCAVLLRPDHHPVADRPSLEPDPISLGRPAASSRLQGRAAASRASGKAYSGSNL